MLIHAIVIIIMLQGTPQGTTDDTSSTPSYYPHAIGSKWIYAIEGEKKERDLTVVISRRAKVGDTDCYTSESWIEGKPVATEVFSANAGIFKRHKMSDLDIAPPLIFAKARMQSGDSWTAKYSLTLNNKTVETEIKYRVTEETVKVPAGEYRALLITGTMKTGEIKMWLAPDLGPVKMYYNLGEGNKATLNLKSTNLPIKK